MRSIILGTSEAGEAGATERARARTGHLLKASRRGAAAVWSAVLITGLMLGVSLVVDGALMYGARADLQSAADSSALAGASALAFEPEEVRARAVGYAAKNEAGGAAVEVLPGDVELGDWDPDARTFTPLAGGLEPEADAVRVTTRLDTSRGTGLGLALAGLFGMDEGNARADAIAVFKPRDIVLVMDLSGSMTFDSMLRSVDRLGHQAVVDNLRQIWDQLGSTGYGNMGFETVYIGSSDRDYVRWQLGLNGVEYPFPSGSWNDYINYVMSDWNVYNAGYHRRYGGVTLTNYWLARRRRASQTPGLHATSQQPLTAVKDAIDVFIDVLHQEDTDDRLGLAVYTAADGTAMSEHSLTHDFDPIGALARARQAGHYHDMTNISAGMEVGIDELVGTARPGAHRTMVLLTDGIANRPGSRSEAKARSIDAAHRASDEGVRVLTVSVGLGADTQLMDDIADITGGVHFNVPGGSTIEELESGLREAFRRIAAERPLRLVR